MLQAIYSAGWLAVLRRIYSMALMITDILLPIMGVARIKSWGGQKWTSEVDDQKHFWFYLYGFKIKGLCI